MLQGHRRQIHLDFSYLFASRTRDVVFSGHETFDPELPKRSLS
jgi:hypothetical protein